MIKQNIAANFIGRAWGFISVYLFIPLYLKFLGIEAFGLIGFYSTLVGVLAFADMGFTATLNREMARLSVQRESAGEMRDLLRTYEATYLFISLSIAILLWFLAPMIATKWLRAQNMSHAEIAWAIRIMGVAIAFQMPASLFHGGLMGLQKQVLANTLQISWGMFRGVGAVLVLWLLSPTIFAFASWQLLTNAVYCFLLRFNLWNVLSFNVAKPKFKIQVFQNTWRYAAGMVGMSLISIALTQTDKLAVSKILPLEMLGYYSLAGTVAVVIVSFGGPIATAIFPQLTGLVALNDKSNLHRLYHKSCEMISIAIMPVALTLSFFSYECIFVWTGSEIAAQKAYLAASFLVCGQLMQTMTVIPYYIALANGNVKLNIIIGIASIILITPLLLYLTKQYGIIGSGMSWLIMNIFTFPPYMYFLHRLFLPGEFLHWCIYDVGKPLLISLACVLTFYFLLPRTDSRLLAFFLLGCVWLTSFIITTLSSSDIRSFLREQLNKYQAKAF